MSKTQEYAAGWMDLSIHDFLSTLEEPSSAMTYALITCLDSSFEVAGLLTKNSPLKRLEKHCEIVGQGVLVRTKRLLAADRSQRLFFGFDEVWFCDRRKVSAKPKEIVITGPATISEEQVGRMAGWMHENGCSLALGDGTGLNFCARLRGVARDLVRAFAECRSQSDSGRASA